MDFIPLPDNVASHVPVPDLGGPDYDNLGFLGYDQRQAWNVKALREGRLDAARSDWGSYERMWLSTVSLARGISLQETRVAAMLPRISTKKRRARRVVLAAAFIQTWILYGIFQEVLKRPVSRDELSSATSSDSPRTLRAAKYITVRRVFNEFLAQRQTWRQVWPAPSHWVRCLREASMVVSNFLHISTFPKDCTVLQSVFCALSALIEEVYISLVAYCSPLDQDVPVFVRQAYFAQKLQEQRGWCPNMIKRIGSQLRIAGLYYASIVPNLLIEKAHEHCTRDLCIAYNTDNKSYAIRHVPKYCLCVDSNCNHKNMTCPCKDVAMPDTPFRAAFQNGGFPIVRFDGDNIEITEYQDTSLFIAISHPWSDGRGNPAANALPICQLREINEYVTANWVESHPIFSSDVPSFWIDTLCVPLEEPLRNTAIQGMAKVYSSAYKVLVLSEELIANKMPSTTAESLVRIYCSKWHTRLWLLFEAALARNIVFQFSDRSALQRILSKDAKTALGNPVDQSFLLIDAAFHQGTSIVDAHDWRISYSTISLVWSRLRHRTSSRLSDAAICCSVILGTDLARVLAAPDNEKVQTFWTCQADVPATILFVRGPHLKADGFRWAPSNLLDPQSLSSPIHDRARNDIEARPTMDGLLVRGLRAVELEFPKAYRSKLHMYRFSLPGSRQRYFFMLGGILDEPWVALLEELGNKWDGRCVLLLSGGVYGPDILESVALTVPSPRPPHIEGSPDTIHCRYTRYVLPSNVWYEGEPESRIALAHLGHTRANWAANLGRRSVTDMGELQCIETSQNWCVY